MRIMTFNVGIWTRNRKKSDPNYWKPRMQAMKQMLEYHKPDVICFQELWFPANRYIPSCYKKVKGTGMEHPIYIMKGIKVLDAVFSIFYSSARLFYRGRLIDVFNVHGHWDAYRTTKLCSVLRDQYLVSSVATVVCGDMNNTLSTLSSLLPGLTSARIVKNIEESPTYIHFKNPNNRGEYDHFFVSNEMNVFRYTIIGGTENLEGRISDHFPVCITVA